MSWNYRVFKREYVDGCVVETLYEIHEVYYHDETGEVIGLTESSVDPGGEDIADLRWGLEKMLEALDKPVLNYEDYEAKAS